MPNILHTGLKIVHIIKSNTNRVKKMQKNTIFGPSLAIFAQNWTNQNFLGKSKLLIKKTNKLIFRKTTKTQMDR